MTNTTTSDLAPLTDDEIALCYHVTRFGSAGYPVERVGRRWHWRAWRSVKGAPVSYTTKRAAVAAFESWHTLALLRWNSTRKPGQIMTAVGMVQS